MCKTEVASFWLLPGCQTLPHSPIIILREVRPLLDPFPCIFLWAIKMQDNAIKNNYFVCILLFFYLCFPFGVSGVHKIFYSNSISGSLKNSNDSAPSKPNLIYPGKKEIIESQKKIDAESGY